MSFSIRAGEKAKLCLGSAESEAVRIAAGNLKRDLERVLPGVEVSFRETDGEDIPIPGVCGQGAVEAAPGRQAAIVIRTVAGDKTVTDAEREGFLDGSGRLRKEAYTIKVRDGKLYLLGSDRRGTIYAIYSFCEWMGVSPWHFFADVPVRERQEIALEEGYCRTDWPSVEYRGIFINDEEELEAWVKGYMGEPTIGVKSYEKIFELLLRLKANYIWPAMHVNSFNLTPENGALADRMGIVVGTSHCDMLMRSNNREWIPWLRKKGYQDAAYDYSIEGKNREILKEYWRESVEQNRDYEVCYTLGMRGIHDSGFETKDLKGSTEEEIRDAKIALLEKIISDQRDILKDTLGRDTMMTFIPYKEVLELYDHGLEIPEDMTLVWANDNYGYIRRYPSKKEKARSGGNGIYFHNSYWAPPSMSYVFLCSIPLSHTRNELWKAWKEGIRKLWVLNSGAIKPLEQEITFFLRLAWEIGKPGALTEDVETFTEKWADSMFSGHIGKQVSMLLNDFSQLTNVRKLENMDYDAFSQTAYGDEAAMRIRRYEELFDEGNALYQSLPEGEKDAFFQLVLMRIHAAYFTNLAYYWGDRSTLMYDRGNMQAAALYTERSREAEDARRRLLHYYNHVMCKGKWNGVLNPEGFPPPRAAMMPACTPPLCIEGEPSMRVDVWNGDEELCFVIPGEKWIDIGNTGTGEFCVRLHVPVWAELSEEQAVVRTERRILIRVKDTDTAREGEITVENLSDGSRRSIPVRIKRPACGQAERMENSRAQTEQENSHAETASGNCADMVLEEDGLVVIEASLAQSGLGHGGDFRLIRRLGRMRGDLIEAQIQREPADTGQVADRQGSTSDLASGCAGELCGTAARPVCYSFAVHAAGEFLLEIHRFPSLNSVGRIRAGVSVDGGPVQLVESLSNDEWRGSWRKNVLNNVDRLYLRLPFLDAGIHRLSVWAVDRYFAFSRLVIYTGERKENSLAGLRGAQPLPREWDIAGWCDAFYGAYTLPPRPVFYASYEKGGDSLAATCREMTPKWGGVVEPSWYLERGNHHFEEMEGSIRIDAASALAQSRFAWFNEPLASGSMSGESMVSEPGTAEEASGYSTAGHKSGLWRHCAGESFGRSGLAMYIRTPELSWRAQAAPGLHYRIKCGGGEYTFWMLTKFNVREESVFSIGIDSELIPEDRLYRRGELWRYEAEQIYRWVPAARVELEAGEHVLHICALASGMRYDRFYLTRGEEQPPQDADWITDRYTHG